MDDVTQAVRTMYERYPYPAGGPVFRTGTDARVLLSWGARPRPGGGPIHALDAGCGRGAGLIGCAVLQPDVEFTGIDVNRVALKEVERAIADRGLANARVAEVDLMTLDGLELPAGGFDVVYSSGVVHHLADPAEGLRRLREVLAPHGVLHLMLYAHQGRAPLERLQRGIELVAGDEPLADRIAPGRLLARAAAEGGVLAGSPWSESWRAVDVEFVDQALHVNETSYDLDGLWALLDGADLRFLRWLEPADWDVDVAFADLLATGGEGAEALVERARVLPARDREHLIEQVLWRPSFELAVTPRENAPREEATPETALDDHWAVNPEVTFAVESRCPRGSLRTESLSYRLRNREPVRLQGGLFAETILLLREESLPFRGADFAALMAQRGVGSSQAQALLVDLARREVLYRPHAVDA